MIDRLRRELADIENLSPDEQEELALYIAALRDARARAALRDARAREASGFSLAPTEAWHDPAGSWIDLPEDDEAETFHRMRHETEPSPPFEL